MCTDARVMFVVNATEELGARPLDVGSEALCAHVIWADVGALMIAAFTIQAAACFIVSGGSRTRYSDSVDKGTSAGMSSSLVHVWRYSLSSHPRAVRSVTRSPAPPSTSDVE